MTLSKPRRAAAALICLTLPALLPAAPDPALLQEQARLSIYFGTGADEYARNPSDTAANSFAIVGLDRHILHQSSPPRPRFRDPAQAAPFYPQGVDLTARFFDPQGRPVATLDEPGFYGAEISIQAAGGTRYTIRRLLLRLPPDAPLPTDTSEAAMLRHLAAQRLGRPWTPADPSLYTYALQWLWEVDRTTGRAAPLDYHLLLPPDYASASAQGRKFPLYIDLHGSGATRFDFPKFLADPYLKTFETYAARGLIVAAPHSRVQWQAPAIADLLTRLRQTLAIDPARISIGGHSMGASGTWRVLDAIPEHFAAALPVAGGNVPPLEKVPRFTGTAVWAAFGSRDNPEAQDRTRTFTRAVQEAGGDARFTVIPEANHMTSRQIFFSEPLVLEWLLAQRKPGS